MRISSKRHRLTASLSIALSVACGSEKGGALIDDSGPSVDAPTADISVHDDGAPDAATEDAAGDVRADAAPPPLTYENFVLDESGDPFCARFGDAYYLYLPDQVRRDGAVVGGRVLGFTSTDLVHWKSVGEVFSNVDDAYGGQKTIGLWAPEVLSRGGKFYLYYAGLMSNPADDRVGDKDIVVVESSDPTDFTGGKRTVLLDDAYAFIDPSPFADPVSGDLFLVYKRRGAFGSGSEIDVRPLASPTALVSGAAGMPSMVVDSEKVADADHVVEQPMLFREKNLYYLLYSKGSGSGTNYQIPYATSSNATGPFVERGILFHSDDDLSGDVSKKVISPGSSSIVLDGAKNPWVVYRQKSTKVDTFADRGVAIDEVSFDPPSQSMKGKPTHGVVRPGPAPL